MGKLDTWLQFLEPAWLRERANFCSPYVAFRRYLVVEEVERLAPRMG